MSQGTHQSIGALSGARYTSMVTLYHLSVSTAAVRRANCVRSPTYFLLKTQRKPSEKSSLKELPFQRSLGIYRVGVYL